MHVKFHHFYYLFLLYYYLLDGVRQLNELGESEICVDPCKDPEGWLMISSALFIVQKNLYCT